MIKLLFASVCAMTVLAFTGCAVERPRLPPPVVNVTLPVEDPRTNHVTAELHLPQGDGPFPAVVVLSGCFGVAHDAGLVDALNASYLRAGVATLVLDSLTARRLDEVCSDPKLNVDSIAWRVRDVYAAVDWLAARPGIDAKRIYLQGFSHGAVAAIGAIDGQWPRRRFPAVAGVIAVTPYCLQGSRFTAPTLVLAAELDDWSPARLCETIEDRRNLSLHIYPKAHHGFAVPARDTVFQGHRLKHDPVAAEDALRRALEFIQRSR